MDAGSGHLGIAVDLFWLDKFPSLQNQPLTKVQTQRAQPQLDFHRYIHSPACWSLLFLLHRLFQSGRCRSALPEGAAGNERPGDRFVLGRQPRGFGRQQYSECASPAPAWLSGLCWAALRQTAVWRRPGQQCFQWIHALSLHWGIRTKSLTQEFLNYA